MPAAVNCAVSAGVREILARQWDTKPKGGGGGGGVFFFGGGGGARGLNTCRTLFKKHVLSPALMRPGTAGSMSPHSAGGLTPCQSTVHPRCEVYTIGCTCRLGMPRYWRNGQRSTHAELIRHDCPGQSLSPQQALRHLSLQTLVQCSLVAFLRSAPWGLHLVPYARSSQEVVSEQR